ncbi:hypothetical protein NQZ68_029370 [Dissostichus eleginoides]|nr:hypothetical protein NQZ68_029370 [Dissostichus eleginoides]
MNDHGAHLRGLGAPARLFDHGDKGGGGTLGRTDCREEELKGKGSLGERRDSRGLSMESSFSPLVLAPHQSLAAVGIITSNLRQAGIKIGSAGCGQSKALS